MKIKLLNENARVPTRGTDDAAGFDLYAALDQPIKIGEGETKLIPTGIALEIPKGYFGAIFPRSGFATKRGLRLANCVAVIDSDYRGPVQVPLYRDVKHDTLTAGSFFSYIQSPEMETALRSLLFSPIMYLTLK